MKHLKRTMNERIKEGLRVAIEKRLAAIKSNEDYYRFLGYIDIAETLDIITVDEWLDLVDAAMAINGGWHCDF